MRDSSPRYPYRDDRPGVIRPTRVRRLRGVSTDAERLLWSRLRSRQLGGAKFRRQHEFGPYVLDFCCVEARLVIEVDGGGHFRDDTAADDQRRTQYLKDRGLRVLRFTNTDVLGRLESVLTAILEVVGTSPSP